MVLLQVMKTILKIIYNIELMLDVQVLFQFQEAAAVAWNDQNHVAEFRKKYKRNFEIAKRDF